MFSAAPRPRPPQPIRPTLIVSLPAAWALVSSPKPIVAAVEPFKKSRREADDACGGLGSVMVLSPGARLGIGSNRRVALGVRPLATGRYDGLRINAYPCL